MITAEIRQEVMSSAGALIAAVALGATVLLSLTGAQTGHAIQSEPYAFLVLLGLALVLQRFSVPIGVTGYIGVAPVGILAAAFMLGPGPAITIAALAPLTRLFTGSLPHRVAFDCGQFALSAGAAAFAYQALTGPASSGSVELAAAAVAGLVYTTVNNLLVCWVFSLVGGGTLFQAWNAHFSFGRYHYLAFGPLAFGSAFAYAELGVAGLVAFNIPSALVLVSIRQYVDSMKARTEVLTRSNDDLKSLFEFASGLAMHSHDRQELVAYAEGSLSTLFSCPVSIGDVPRTGHLVLEAGGEVVGSLALSESDRFDHERWARLRDVVLPQLATALESASLVARVRKTQHDKIAALSRSMEAKDLYTGGHTERVATIALAIGEELGFEGDELEALEVGALLHDVGKIGIPERILHKPGPLDEDEWRVMRSHPIISDKILSEIELHPLVRQIARWSHERIDGCGYPDRLAGDEIPLAARIVFVADAFDALTSDRPYRPRRSLDDTFAELRTSSARSSARR